MASNRNIHVLLVDDEPAFRQTLSKRLVKRGLEVFEVGGGREALNYLAETPVDVVVLDMKMPDMDGLATLQSIKTDHPGVEVILLTGQVSAQDGISGIMAGAFDYLTKPVEVEHLFKKIKQAFDRILWKEEQARAEVYRADVEKRMDAAERLASLGTMAAGIAHEINNPLAIISESAGWLKGCVEKEKELPFNLRERFLLALGKIEASVERAGKITHQLLGFARKNDWTYKDIDLCDLAEEVVDFTGKAAADANADVTFNSPPKPVVIFTDPNQVRQVMINIVTNAIQAVDREGKVVISIQDEGSRAIIKVEDNGPGIPKENLERIFEPFFSTKPPGKGTGLGLSVSKNIMDKLEGKITVESRIGAGTAFILSLPAKRHIHSSDHAGTDNQGS